VALYTSRLKERGAHKEKRLSNFVSPLCKQLSNLGEGPMVLPEPVSSALTTITLGVVANIATDILKHYSRALKGTLVGRLLVALGFREPDFEKRVHDSLVKAILLFFREHPDHDLTGIDLFFRDPAVGRQIGGYILDRRPIDEHEIQEAIQHHLLNDPLTAFLIENRGIKPEMIVPEFLRCYRYVLGEQLSVPEMGLLLSLIEQTDSVVDEIRASETRLQTFIKDLLSTTLSSTTMLHAYQSGQREILADLTDELEASNLVKPQQTEQTVQDRFQSLPYLFSTGLCKGMQPRPRPDRYFISHAFDSDPFADWRQTLSEALAHVGGVIETLTPYVAGETLESAFRLCNTCEKLFSTRFSVFLLPPSQDRNVYLELGIAIGISAPFLIIQHHLADVPQVLAGLTRYVKGGLFRTMRRELPGLVQEYDFGVVHFPKPASSLASSTYLILSGDLIDDEDFEGAIVEAVRKEYPSLEGHPLESQFSGPDWMIEQLVRALLRSRFAVFRIDEKSSAVTFLALGITIGLGAPFLMIARSGEDIPLDLRGLGTYRYPNYVTLLSEFTNQHRAFLERYAV
jgi:hypothetical protein